MAGLEVVLARVEMLGVGDLESIWLGLLCWRVLVLVSVPVFVLMLWVAGVGELNTISSIGS